MLFLKKVTLNIKNGYQYEKYPLHYGIRGGDNWALK